MMSSRSQSSWLRQAILALVALALLLAPLHNHESTAGDTVALATAVMLDSSGSTPDPQPDNGDHKYSPCPVCLLLKQVASIDGFALPEKTFGSIDRPRPKTEAMPSAMITDLFRPPIAAAA